jgi:transposase
VDTQQLFLKGSVLMFYVGIDVSKAKHDAIIINSEGEIIQNVFSFTYDSTGFNQLLSLIPDVPAEQVKVGLETTGHYSLNLMRFINEHQFPLIVLNPLQTNLFRKAHTLRKNKTDKIDARLIALMLQTGNFKSYSDVSYHLEELKSLTRNKSRIKKNLSRYKISLIRVLDIMFPELASMVYSINQKSTYALLKVFPSKDAIAYAYLAKLTHILKTNSKGKYGRDKVLVIRNSATNSIATDSHALSFELIQTIKFIEFYQSEIQSIDFEIKSIMDKLQYPLLTIPGISYGLASVILSEIGDIKRFDSPYQLLAYAGLEPATHSSGKFTASGMKMVKRGSTHLRWALLEAARLIAMQDPAFKTYYLKKKAEGKHHYVAVSRVAKKISSYHTPFAKQ